MLGATKAAVAKIRFVAVAVAFAVAGVLALPAVATPPQAVQIEMVGSLTGPSSAAGTWTATGAFSDAGTYTETFRFAGTTIHGEKVLSGRNGTIVLDVRGLVVQTDPCTVTFKAGSWNIAGGTGVYASLHGGGEPLLEPGGFGNLCTGAVRVTHAGTAHFDAAGGNDARFATGFASAERGLPRYAARRVRDRASDAASTGRHARRLAAAPGQTPARTVA